MKKCELYEIKKTNVECDLNDLEYGDNLEIWIRAERYNDLDRLIMTTFIALIAENDRYYYAIVEK